MTPPIMDKVLLLCMFLRKKMLFFVLLLLLLSGLAFLRHTSTMHLRQDLDRHASLAMSNNDFKKNGQPKVSLSNPELPQHSIVDFELEHCVCRRTLHMTTSASQVSLNQTTKFNVLLQMLRRTKIKKSIIFLLMYL